MSSENYKGCKGPGTWLWNPSERYGEKGISVITEGNILVYWKRTGLKEEKSRGRKGNGREGRGGKRTGERGERERRKENRLEI